MTHPATAQRIASFGTTIFTEMSALALAHNAVNLGEGFPDFAVLTLSKTPPWPQSKPTSINMPPCPAYLAYAKPLRPPGQIVPGAKSTR
jgi:hypothetical protein